MGSFDCPHRDPERDYCYRLERSCDPGQKGCVLEESNFIDLSSEEMTYSPESGAVSDEDRK